MPPAPAPAPPPQVVYVTAPVPPQAQLQSQAPPAGGTSTVQVPKIVFWLIAALIVIGILIALLVLLAQTNGQLRGAAVQNAKILVLVEQLAARRV